MSWCGMNVLIRLQLWNSLYIYIYRREISEEFRFAESEECVADKIIPSPLTCRLQPFTFGQRLIHPLLETARKWCGNWKISDGYSRGISHYSMHKPSTISRMFVSWLCDDPSVCVIACSIVERFERYERYRVMSFSGCLNSNYRRLDDVISRSMNIIL